jgi:peptidoglycan/LPS O-acetylase OafA/YrhL
VRYQSLDIWRGVACLMVVVVHSSFYWKFDAPPVGSPDRSVAAHVLGLVPMLGMGVQIFFVISGYCIAATADSVRRKQGRTAEYFRRRVRRIFPPYWAALLLAIVLPALVAALGWPGLFGGTGAVNTGSIPAAAELTGWQWLGNLTLTEEWRHQLFGSDQRNLLGPAWSLCYEEQFYLVCGVILLIAPRRFFAGALLVTFGTLVLMVVSVACGGLPIRGFFFDGRWLLFAAGVFIYYHHNYATPRGRWLVPAGFALAITAALVVRYGFLAGGTTDQKSWAFEYVAAMLFAIVLLGVRRWDEVLARARILKPLAACGTMCYSLYLIHWPITKLTSAALFRADVRGAWPTLLLTIPLAMTASLVAAWGFHLLVERRFLNQPAGARQKHAHRAETPSVLTPRPALGAMAIAPVGG